MSVSTHISGMDLLERALINTTEMIEDDKLQAFKDEGYNGRRNGIGKQIMNGNATLYDMANDCLEKILRLSPSQNAKNISKIS